MSKLRILVAIFISSTYLCLMPLCGYCQQSSTTFIGIQWLTSVQQTEGNWGEWNTPAHVHFKILLNGEAVDPNSFIMFH